MFFQHGTWNMETRGGVGYIVLMKNATIADGERQQLAAQQQASARRSSIYRRTCIDEPQGALAMCFGLPCATLTWRSLEESIEEAQARRGV